MSQRIDLVYDRECPNVDAARAQLQSALAEMGLPPRWAEWEREAPETPSDLRGLGSPTILVNGVDVTDVPDVPVEAVDAERANCCRVYEDEGRLRGVPPVRAIVAALSHPVERQ